MFVRRKKNKSGSVSVQIIDKSHGWQVARTVGSAQDPDEVEQLFRRGQQLVRQADSGQQKLLAVKSQSDLAIESFLNRLVNANIRTIGPELIFGALFDRLGFNQINDELFRHLTIARLAFPLSKLKTADYLYRYRGISVSEDTIYRFLDRLASQHKAQVEKISYQYTKRHLKNITAVFYDMTSLYFQAEDEDDLRKIGYSKDGKFNKPQIMIGLLVGASGLPIGYDIFAGNTAETHTLLPVLAKLQRKYRLGKPVVIADAALLSKKNLKELTEQDYQFILGGRIKNESDLIKQKILKKAQNIKDGQGFSLKKDDNNRLIVTYSQTRARKDAKNRQRGLKRLQAKVKSGTVTKSDLNQRGYNKFLQLEGEAKVKLDDSKIEADRHWDGLKGYVTNTDLTWRQTAANYSHLWQIERAFRISKTDLKVRPIYHQLRKRIEAHVCISFVAYTIYKELELLLKKKGSQISAKRAGELTHNMYQLNYTLPDSREEKQQILGLDDEQQVLHDAVHG